LPYETFIPIISVLQLRIVSTMFGTAIPIQKMATMSVRYAKKWSKKLEIRFYLMKPKYGFSIILFHYIHCLENVREFVVISVNHFPIINY
jgi:hypothetical protein